MKFESNPIDHSEKKDLNHGIKSETVNIEDIRNYEQVENGVSIKKIEAVHTPLWHTGWYKNPTSGRSYNYGLNTENPQDHSTVIIKGGAFFLEEKFVEFASKNSFFMSELYGGITMDAAKKEYEIAKLIQEKFKDLLNKNANCPKPITAMPIVDVKDENKHLELIDFFEKNAKKQGSYKENFIRSNFIKTAMKLGIDVYYPANKDAPEEIQKSPFHWVFSQVLEKAQQGIYKYEIEGPNTRLLDLMTLGLNDRKKYFIEANRASNLEDALKNFSGKLGEFYGFLHKSQIGYHSGFSEHCTLADITISGVIMDIGGLSEDKIKNELELKMEEIFKNLKDNFSIKNKDITDTKLPKSTTTSDGMVTPEEYIVQIIKITNLIAYLGKNVFRVDDHVLENTKNMFWEKYKSLYSDKNIEHFSTEKGQYEPNEIRTRYIDHTTGGWIKLSEDLEDLSST